MPVTTRCALAVGLWLLCTPAAHAYCVETTSTAAPTVSNPCIDDGLPLRWGRRCLEVALYVDEWPNDDVRLTTQEIRDLTEVSFSAWEAAGSALGTEVNLIEESGQCFKASFNPTGGNMNTIMFVPDWEDRGTFVNGIYIGYDPGAYAVTTTWHDQSTGEILDVDIEINEQRGPYGVCPITCGDGGCVGQSGELEIVDLQNVLTHEIGHFLV